MFDIDNWIEIFSALKKNKLRTFLTGFSITWGLFMFIILLATTMGAQNGVRKIFGSRAVNSMEVFGRLTSIPYQGLPENRRIQLDDRDYELLNKGTAETEYVSGTISASAIVVYGNTYTTSSVLGIHADYNKINGVSLLDNQGRLIRNIDIVEKRKVAVINRRLREVLFADQNPVGKSFIVGGISYTVIGVFEESALVDMEKMYIPFSTAQMIFKGGWGLESLTMTVKGIDSYEKNDQFSQKIVHNFSKLHTFDPKDNRALGIVSQIKAYLQSNGVFNALNICIWIIGLGTLFAGIVGVSNIMLITVRERTKEFGIRKALGATPISILKQIILESVCITLFFGYIGLFLGVAIIKLFSSFLQSHPDLEGFNIFENPTVNLPVALAALLVLVGAGVLAGYFPARKAVKISPVEAMRSEE